jgi:dipeptidyl aminopeptidase/acylaminoacyl peptidase
MRSDVKIKKQYGLWGSPVSPRKLGKGIKFTDLAWDDDGSLVWYERRSGIGVLVIQPPGCDAHRELNSDFDIRAGVGYGGGDFAVGKGNVYFVEANSGRIYRQPTHVGTAKAITPAFGYAASPTLSPDGKYLLFVHTYEGEDSIGLVDSDGESWPVKLVSGDDFYMQPCWHPDNSAIAWIAWNHPQMPWDATTLYLGKIKTNENGPRLESSLPIVGDERTSVFQPQFSPDGRFLAYIADPDGWWHLYLYDLVSGEHTVHTGGEAEHGVPAWVQGLRTYEFSPDGKSIYYLRNQDGFVGLWKLDLDSKVNTRVQLGSEYTWLTQVAVSSLDDTVAMIASGSQVPERVITSSESDPVRVLRRSLPEELPDGFYALPQPLTWQGLDGEQVHGLFYAPQSQNYTGLGKPPLMLQVHGGPTSQRYAAFDGQVQYFTSRGWAVLQVNYRGSTGYGRAYRHKLKGNWGIYDVQDAVSGADYLGDVGLVDREKAVIMGGSAGGFTVLKTLEDYPGKFKAGICLYGIGNQFSLVADTHKFEARYSDWLLGSLPEAADVYRERSPVFFADRIKDPVAIFQGEDDKVVPKDQSDQIVRVLQRNGIPHEYHIYPNEGHGFRRAETIEKFYSTIERFLEQNVLY